MAVPYEVRPSKLQVGSFSAVVRTGPIFDADALAAEMASRSGFNVSECAAFLGLVGQVSRDHLALGENVQLGDVCVLSLSLKGKLPTGESFADIANLTVGAKAQPELTEWLRTNATLEKRDASYTGPSVSSVFNVTQNAANKAATGNLVRLVGSQLKFNSAQADEGVFFMPAGGGAGVQATVFATATAGRIELIVPTLAPGNHFVEVRARRKGSTGLQTYRYPVSLPQA